MDATALGVMAAMLVALILLVAYFVIGAREQGGQVPGAGPRRSPAA